MFKKIMRWFEIIGYARAAQELYRQGYYAEAKQLMLEYNQLRSQ